MNTASIWKFSLGVAVAFVAAGPWSPTAESQSRPPEFEVRETFAAAAGTASQKTLAGTTAGDAAKANARKATAPSTSKVIIQVLDPASAEARRLPAATQFARGMPVAHLMLSTTTGTLQVPARSVIVLQSDRPATIQVGNTDVVDVSHAKYVLPNNVIAVLEAKTTGTTDLTITYSDQAPDCQNAPYCSPNWSGYLLLNSTGQTFTGITGQWTVPAVVSLPQGVSASWVGIGGWGSSDIIQAGTVQAYDPGINPFAGADYYAWYELFPNPSVTIPNKPVAPGDVIQVSITPTPGTPTPVPGQQSSWHILMTNVTKGWVYSATEQFTGDLSSAEWIEEAPSYNSGQLTMADYQQVEFNFNNKYAQNGGDLVPAYFVQGDQVWLNQNGINGIYSTPSNPSGDGKGFYVTFTDGFPNQGFPPGPWIQTTSLPPALLGQPYNQALIVNEAASPSWSLQAGSLPPGLTLDASLGVISGAPTQLGLSDFVVLATDTSNGSTAAQGLTINVLGDPESSLQVNCSSVNPPVAGTTVNVTVDGKSQQCYVAINLPTGLHTVQASVSGGPQQPYKITYIGACNASGQVTLTQGNPATCTITAESLKDFETACPQGKHCCSPSASGCTQCIANKYSCP